MPLELADPSREQDSQYERLRAIAWSWRGVSGKGIALRQTTVNDDSNYAGDFANGGSGSLALRATAGSHSLTVTSGGISLSSLTVSGNLSVLGNTTLGNANSDSTTIQGSLTQSGGAVSLSSPTTVSITATGAGTLTATSWSVVGPATLSSTLTATDAATFQSTLTAQGNVTVRNGATGATLALFDVSNTRLLVGSGTALTSAADDRFSVIGGMAYFAGNSGPSLGLRYSSSETTGWTIGLAAAGSGQALQLATTTANTSSLVQTVPNGSSTQSGFVAYNNAAPTSASVSGVFRANATNLQIRCDSPSGPYNGFGLAGGGFGSYAGCQACDAFIKIRVPDDGDDAPERA